MGEKHTDGSSEEEAAKRAPVRDRRGIEASGGPEEARTQDHQPDPSLRSGEELERAKQEAAIYLDDLKRLKAEFENYRKRILKEQTEVVERASAHLVGRLLPVLDNFDLAVSAAEATRDFDRMLRGVELVFGELKEVLATEGLTEIEAKGKKFDPSLHEAAVEVPGDPDGDLIVAEVLRPGYRFGGRVLRPAMVKVTREA